MSIDQACEKETTFKAMDWMDSPKPKRLPATVAFLIGASERRGKTMKKHTRIGPFLSADVSTCTTVAVDLAKRAFQVGGEYNLGQVIYENRIKSREGFHTFLLQLSAPGNIRVARFGCATGQDLNPIWLIIDLPYKQLSAFARRPTLRESMPETTNDRQRKLAGCHRSNFSTLIKIYGEGWQVRQSAGRW
jgi:hypothetical protein